MAFFNKPNLSSGFTIIEVMVAGFIGVLLLFGAYEFAIYANRGSQRLMKLADDQGNRLATKTNLSCFTNPGLCPPVSNRLRTRSGTFSAPRGGRTRITVPIDIMGETAICFPIADHSPGGTDWATCQCFNRDTVFEKRVAYFSVISDGSVDGHCSFFYLVLGDS